MTNIKERNKKKQEKKKNILESEILAIMQKSLKTALDMALEELLKDFK